MVKRIYSYRILILCQTKNKVLKYLLIAYLFKKNIRCAISGVLNGAFDFKTEIPL